MKPNKPATILKQIFRISNIHCGHCADEITTIVKQLDGIQDVVASLSEASIRVTFDLEIVSSEKIATLIQKAGFNIRSDDLDSN